MGHNGSNLQKMVSSKFYSKSDPFERIQKNNLIEQMNHFANVSLALAIKLDAANDTRSHNL